MSDSDDSDNKFAVMDLIDGAVVADAGAPGVASSEFFTTGRSGIAFELQEFIFDAGGNAVRQLVELLSWRV
jgi:hypothetical protein